MTVMQVHRCGLLAAPPGPPAWRTADLRLWAAMEAASEAGARLLAEFHRRPHLPALLVSVGPILVCWLLLLVTDGPEPQPPWPSHLPPRPPRSRGEGG